MNIKFRILFTVTLSHTYYRDGLCKDFDFRIPTDTQQWLNNGRLLVKVREGKLYVLFEVGEDNQPLVLLAEQTLQFGLKLNNPFFSNFTQLDINSAQAFLYKNTTIHPNQLAPPENRPVISLPMELQRQGIFGIIEITLDNEHFYTTDPKKVPDFKISFAAREETLKYYVVAKNYTDAEIEQLTVSDQGNAGITFTREFIEKNLLGRVLLFKSMTAVKRQETAREKIQLNKNGEALIKHLPQPSVSKTAADFIIQLSKP